MLRHLVGLSDEDGVFQEGMFRIDLDHIEKEDADAIFKAMGAKESMPGDYELIGRRKVDGALDEQLELIRTRAAAVKIKEEK